MAFAIGSFLYNSKNKLSSSLNIPGYLYLPLYFTANDFVRDWLSWLSFLSKNDLLVILEIPLSSFLNGLIGLRSRFVVGMDLIWGFLYNLVTFWAPWLRLENSPVDCLENFFF